MKLEKPKYYALIDIRGTILVSSKTLSAINKEIASCSNSPLHVVALNRKPKSAYVTLEDILWRQEVTL